MRNWISNPFRNSQLCDTDKFFHGWRRCHDRCAQCLWFCFCKTGKMSQSFKVPRTADGHMAVQLMQPEGTRNAYTNGGYEAHLELSGWAQSGSLRITSKARWCARWSVKSAARLAHHRHEPCNSFDPC